MSGETELNVDSLIARLMEGKRQRNDKRRPIELTISSTWLSAGKDRSDDRRRNTWLVPEITRDLPQSADSSRARSTVEDMR